MPEQAPPRGGCGRGRSCGRARSRRARTKCLAPRLRWAPAQARGLARRPQRVRTCRGGTPKKPKPSSPSSGCSRNGTHRDGGAPARIGHLRPLRLPSQRSRVLRGTGPGLVVAGRSPRIGVERALGARCPFRRGVALSGRHRLQQRHRRPARPPRRRRLLDRQLVARTRARPRRLSRGCKEASTGARAGTSHRPQRPHSSAAPRTTASMSSRSTRG